MPWQDAPIIGRAEPQFSFADEMNRTVQQPVTPQQPANPFGQSQSQGPMVTHTTADGGRIYRMPDGSQAYAGPNYSTTDPAQIARLMDGATPQETWQSSMRQGAIDEHPVASRAAMAIRGVPFVGDWADEAIGVAFGDRARDATRYLQGAMEQERPGEALAYELGGAVAGSVPLALAAGPGLMARAPNALGAQMAAGAGLGATAGGVEGLVSGAGRGEDPESRMQNALSFGGMGAGMGGVVGVGAPAVGYGVRNIADRFRNPTRQVAGQIGASPDAAQVISRSLRHDDFGAGREALRRAGPTAMLADAGPASRQLLDTAIVGGGAAGRIAREAIDERLSHLYAGINDTMDRTLGPITGRESIIRNIREGTQQGRHEAYTAAYAQPIDYSSGGGRRLEALLPRVPQSAIESANLLMRMEGAESAQIMARVGNDGSVAFETLPDVQQWDYISRGLDNFIQQGRGLTGGFSQEGNTARNLQTAIRSTLRDEVPAYAAALEAGADAIQQRNAAELGYNLLRPGMTREAVADGLRGAGAAQLEAARVGLRSSIDDTLANIGRVASDANIDARELQRLTNTLTSRAARDKVRQVLGRREADELFSSLDEAIIGLELRAAVSRNSATAVRQQAMSDVQQMTAPGGVAILAQGSPVQASRRMVSVMTGNTPEAVMLRQQGIYDDIARVLTGAQGDEARVALRVLQNAIEGGQVTESQARLIGRAFATAFALGGHQTGTQILTRQ